MKKNFIFETLLIIFLGSLTSLSLPPYNFFFLNFFTFSVFFIFLFQRLKQGIKKSFYYGWLFGFSYFLSSLYWLTISLSFDKSFNGDFKLKDNLLQKGEDNNFIYIGCKIFNKSLFENYNLKNFSILEVWKELQNKNQLNGYESLNKFYHLTNLETFKKLKDL